MNEVNDADDDLAEYRALVVKVDAAVDAAAARAGDQVTCHAGCSSCCVDGLSVLPVEAFAIAAHTAVHGLPRSRTRAGDGCVFLDDDGRCVVYAARPLLCRTHGLPLRTSTPTSDGEASSTTGAPKAKSAARALRIVDDVSVCSLNFTGRDPAGFALDADVLLKLLVTVDRRFRVRAALADDHARVALRDLAADLTADDG
jgi:Fe-S-cluster containining protein